MRLKIVQAGEPVLRQKARELSVEEIRSREIQQMIEWMRETMRDAPGVGLAAPQVGLALQLAVIEDPADLQRAMSAEKLAERGRRPVPFHVLVNPHSRIVESCAARDKHLCVIRVLNNHGPRVAGQILERRAG